MNRPFAPAMNATVNLLSANLNRDLGQIVQEEAKALGLPEGWQVDVQTRTWVLPDAAPEVVPAESGTPEA